MCAECLRVYVEDVEDVEDGAEGAEGAEGLWDVAFAFTWRCIVVMATRRSADSPLLRLTTLLKNSRHFSTLLSGVCSSWPFE